MKIVDIRAKIDYKNPIFGQIIINWIISSPNLNMSQEFAGIRDKRIPTEFALIERRDDLKNFVIKKYNK